MGVWEEFCSICGGLLWVDEGCEQAWLRDAVGLAPGDVDVPLQGYNGYGAFFTRDGGLFNTKTNVTLGGEGGAHGVVCHRQCVKLVRSMGVPVSYDELWGRLGASGQLKGCYRRLMPVSKYQKQVFDLEGLHRDGLGWVLKSPARAGRNRERIHL